LKATLCRSLDHARRERVHRDAQGDDIIEKLPNEGTSASDPQPPGLTEVSSQKKIPIFRTASPSFYNQQRGEKYMPLHKKKRFTKNEEPPRPDPSLIWIPPRLEDMDWPGPDDKVFFIEAHPQELTRRREEAAKKRVRRDNDADRGSEEKE
jgi:hypothetical protein